jgi:lysophospholipase L1-like esterase
MKRWLSRLLLVAAGTLVGLLLAEGAVRLLDLAPRLAAIEIHGPQASFVASPNPTLKYVPKPGVGDVNADGFRDRSYARRKPPGTSRIVVLGDSIAFGYCNESRTIPVDRIFTNVLEDEWNGDGTGGGDRIEVLNLSVSGYDTLQEVEFLRETGLAYEPDVVIVAYCLNDLMLASRELFLFRKQADWASYRSLANRAYRSAVFRSHLVRLVWQRAPGLVGFLDGGSAGEGPAPGIERTAEGFRRIREMADRTGFRTVVVIFPFFRNLERYTHGPIHAAVAAQARRHGLEVLDLLPAYVAAAETTSDVCAPCCDIHPNERGHAIAARTIGGYLRAGARGDVEQPPRSVN